MIEIEDVTDAETTPLQQDKRQEAPAVFHGDEAQASEEAVTRSVKSPQTDAKEQGATAGDLAVNDEADLKLIAEAEKCKVAGNSMYKQQNYEAAADLYGDGLLLAPEGQQIRAVLFANRAACYLELQSYKEAAIDCSSAIDIDGAYLKAWHRRSKAYEGLDDVDHAMKDVEKILELNPDDTVARKSLARLQPIVRERQEKMKDEMLGKLKELGNTVLGKFGMSLDNFKAEKDPNTGSYSINFKQ